MNSKTLAAAALLAVFGFALLAGAVTLTKEQVEKVIIPKAYRIAVEDSEDGSTDEMVVGYADIYGKGSSGTPAAQLALFIHEDVLYRSTGWGAAFEQVNCQEKTFTDPPEKGGLSWTATVCDNGRLIGENGGGSILNPDGTEVNDVFTYFLGYDEGGSLNDFVFKFRKDGSREGGRALKLKRILKVVEEPIEWKPQ